MAAPSMTQAFTTPYAIERHPVNERPPVHTIRKMTYDEAYDEASIAASEIGGPNDPDYDSLHDSLLDALCIKHNIE